jgi:hypothetical protein
VDGQKLRMVAQRVGVGHETLRKFVEKITEKPHPATRRKYTRLYREYGGGMRVEEPGARAVAAGILAELKALLSPGRGAASTDVREVFEAAEASGRPLPAAAGALRQFLLRLVADAYDQGGLEYPRGPAKRPKKT